MNVGIIPAPLRGAVDAIPSKSDAHRQLIAAALATRPTEIHLRGTSDDIEATLGALRALGTRIVRTVDGIRVFPAPTVPLFPHLDCGESGSTLRFLLPIAATRCAHVAFTGKGRLPERPIAALTRVMAMHGVHFSAERLPFETTGYLHGGEFALPGSISSQYVTGLLLALPLTPEGGTIHLTTPLQSAAYVAMTLNTLQTFGIDVASRSDRFSVPGAQRYRTPGTITVEGDWSNAAFFLAAGALGDAVTVRGLNGFTRQGDQAILSLLSQFGARVTESNGEVTIRPGELNGQTIDVSGIPDLLPIVAVIGAVAVGETRLVNAARLRLKESDRIAATAALIRALGGQATEYPDALVLQGKPFLQGGTVSSAHDHRIAMAAAIAAIRCRHPVQIVDAGAVSKSYPSFFSDYAQLGGQWHEF